MAYMPYRPFVDNGIAHIYDMCVGSSGAGTPAMSLTQVKDKTHDQS